MSTPNRRIIEKVISILYARDVEWLVLPNDPEPLAKIDYKSDNVSRYLAVSDNASLIYNVTEDSEYGKNTIKLKFKRGSLVVFDGQNHYLYYQTNDLVTP